MVFIKAHPQRNTWWVVEAEEEWVIHKIYRTLRTAFFRMKIRVSSKFLHTFKANYSTVTSSTSLTFYKLQNV